MSHRQLQVLFLLTDYSSSIFSYKECNNLISVMTIWWGPCVKSSLVLFQKGQQHEGSPSGITALSQRRGLHNSMKLWAMPRRVTQDRQVIMKSSDKTWSTGGGNGKPLQYILAMRTQWIVWKSRNYKLGAISISTFSGDTTVHLKLLFRGTWSLNWV